MGHAEVGEPDVASATNGDCEKLVSPLFRVSLIFSRFNFNSTLFLSRRTFLGDFVFFLYIYNYRYSHVQKHYTRNSCTGGQKKKS